MWLRLLLDPKLGFRYSAKNEPRVYLCIIEARLPANDERRMKKTQGRLLKLRFSCCQSNHERPVNCLDAIDQCGYIESSETQRIQRRSACYRPTLEKHDTKIVSALTSIKEAKKKQKKQNKTDCGDFDVFDILNHFAAKKHWHCRPHLNSVSTVSGDLNMFMCVGVSQISET